MASQTVQLNVQVSNAGALDRLNRQLREIAKSAAALNGATASIGQIVKQAEAGGKAVQTMASALRGIRTDLAGVATTANRLGDALGRINTGGRGLAELSRSARAARGELDGAARAAADLVRQTSSAGRSGLAAMARDARSIRNDLAEAARVRPSGLALDPRRPSAAAGSIDAQMDRLGHVLRGFEQSVSRILGHHRPPHEQSQGAVSGFAVGPKSEGSSARTAAIHSVRAAKAAGEVANMKTVLAEVRESMKTVSNKNAVQELSAAAAEKMAIDALKNYRAARRLAAVSMPRRKKGEGALESPFRALAERHGMRAETRDLPGGEREFLLRNRTGEQVGRFSAFPHGRPGFERYAEVHGELAESLRGRGIGPAVYRAIGEDYGRPVAPSHPLNMSRAAFSMWRREAPELLQQMMAEEVRRRPGDFPEGSEERRRARELGVLESPHHRRVMASIGNVFAGLGRRIANAVDPYSDPNRPLASGRPVQPGRNYTPSTFLRGMTEHETFDRAMMAKPLLRGRPDLARRIMHLNGEMFVRPFKPQEMKLATQAAAFENSRIGLEALKARASKLSMLPDSSSTPAPTSAHSTTLDDAIRVARARASAAEAARFMEYDRRSAALAARLDRGPPMTSQVAAQQRAAFDALPLRHLESQVSRRFDAIRGGFPDRSPPPPPPPPVNDLARVVHGLGRSADRLNVAAQALIRAAAALASSGKGDRSDRKERPPTASANPLRQALSLARAAGTPDFDRVLASTKRLPAGTVKEIVRDVASITGGIAPVVKTKAAAIDHLSAMSRAAITQRALSGDRFDQVVERRAREQAQSRGVSLESPFHRRNRPLSDAMAALDKFNKDATDAVKRYGRDWVEKHGRLEKVLAVGRGGQILGRYTGNTRVDQIGMPEGTKRLVHNHPYLSRTMRGGGLSGQDIATALLKGLPVHARTDSGSLFSAMPGRNAPKFNTPEDAARYARRIDSAIARTAASLERAGMSSTNAFQAAIQRVGEGLKRRGDIGYRSIVRGIEKTAIDRSGALLDNSVSGLFRKISARVNEAASSARDSWSRLREDVAADRRFIETGTGEGRYLRRERQNPAATENSLAMAAQRDADRHQRYLDRRRADMEGPEPTWMARQMGQSTTGLGLRQMAGYGLVFGGGLGLGRGFTNAADFDMKSAMTSFLLRGGDQGQVAALKQDVDRIAMNTMFSPSDIGQAALKAALAGRTPAEIRAALPVAANFAAAATASGRQTSAAEGIDFILRTMSGANLKPDQLERVADATAKISTQFNTDLAQLGSAAKYFVGGGARFGLDVASSVAATAQLQESGLVGPTAGRGFSSFLSQGFGRLDGANAKQMKALGFDVSEFVDTSGKIKDGDLPNMLRALKAANEKSGGRIMSLIGDDLARRTAFALTRSEEEIDKLEQAIRSGRGAEGFSRQMASVTMSGARGAIERAKGSIQALQNALMGEGGIGGPIALALDGFANTTESITNAVKAMTTQTPGGTERLGGGFMGAAAGAAGGLALGGLGSVIAKMGGPAVLGALGPWASAFVGATALALLAYNSKVIRDALGVPNELASRGPALPTGLSARTAQEVGLPRDLKVGDFGPVVPASYEKDWREGRIRALNAQIEAMVRRGRKREAAALRKLRDSLVREDNAGRLSRPLSEGEYGPEMPAAFDLDQSVSAEIVKTNQEIVAALRRGNRKRAAELSQRLAVLREQEERRRQEIIDQLNSIFHTGATYRSAQEVGLDYKPESPQTPQFASGTANTIKSIFESMKDLGRQIDTHIRTGFDSIVDGLITTATAGRDELAAIAKDLGLGIDTSDRLKGPLQRHRDKHLTPRMTDPDLGLFTGKQGYNDWLHKQTAPQESPLDVLRRLLSPLNPFPAAKADESVVRPDGHFSSSAAQAFEAAATAVLQLSGASTNAAGAINSLAAAASSAAGAVASIAGAAANAGRGGAPVLRGVPLGQNEVVSTPI